MYKDMIITNAHPDHKPTQKMVIKLEGGSPWFGYIWIDGIIYTIIREEDAEGNTRTVKIHPTN